jgi:Ran GTPase-activating protein (RanGAP) involved in mRNA processing and transport
MEIGWINCRLGDENVGKMTQHLEMIRFLKCLNLSDNNITEEGISYIVRMLNTTNHLRMLDLSDNNLPNKATNAFSKITRNTRLTHLNLSRNRINKPKGILKL